jgi:hypothetical protein
MWHQCGAVIGKVVNKLWPGRNLEKRLRKVVEKAADELRMSQVEVVDEGRVS